MARIFLSYAREDASVAAALARVLERNSHTVWWDRQVGGGARFAREIAAALNKSEAVIVLWSQHSVESSWVQDEAAEGRDNGRLIPILVDGTRPPLGFRQFQTIDLSKWRVRGRVPNIAAIETAIQTVLKGGTLAHPSEPQRRRSWASKVIVAALALVLIAGATLYGTGQFATRTEAASLAVLPFSDLSPTRDKQYFAEGVADEIRTSLASVPGVRVVGRTSIDLLGRNAGLKEVRKQLGVTHMLEGSMRVQGQQMRLDVRLLRTADGVQIWAERFDRDLKDIFSVQNEVGAAVAGRLRVRLWRYPLAERAAPTSVQVYDLVLAAQSKLYEDTYEAVIEANRLAEQATRLDPKYSAAWVTLSRSIHAIDQLKPEGQWGPRWPAERERALQYARRAVAIDPRSGDAQAFLGWAEANGERPELALPRIRKAMELGPGEASVWGLAAITYRQMCDRRGELEASRRWFALEPLDPWREDLVLNLYALGHDAEAETVRRSLSQTSRETLERKLALDRGDFSSALAASWKQGTEPPQLISAYMLNALGKTDGGFYYLPSGYRDSLGAYWRHDYAKAAAQTSFIATAQWDNMRTVAIERALVWTGGHRELLDIFDKRFASVAEFDRRLRCDLPSHAAPIAMALRRVGRVAEANQLIHLAEQRYRQLLNARDNDPIQHVGYIELLLATGRNGDALAALERALDRTGTRGFGPPALRLEFADPIYNPIRDHARFKAVERRIAAWRDKELQELAAAGWRI